MNKINLTINKRKLTCSFGLGFLGELIGNLGVPMNDLERELSSNPFKYVPILIFTSAKYTLMRKGEEADFTALEIADDIDEDGGLNGDKVISFMQAFYNSLSKDVPVDEDNGKTDKKEKK